MKTRHQAILAEPGSKRHRNVGRRERYLAEMDRVLPWAQPHAVVEAFYRKGPSGPGRPAAEEALARYRDVTSVTMVKLANAIRWASMFKPQAIVEVANTLNQGIARDAAAHN